MLVDFSPIGLILNILIVAAVVAAIAAIVRRAGHRRDERVATLIAKERERE